MSIKMIKTPWYRMIKIKKKQKKWNKKYAGKPMTVDETREAIREYGNY